MTSKVSKKKAVGAGKNAQLWDRDALVPLICERLSNGEPLQPILRDIGVPRKTVDDWRLKDATIRELFHDARDDGWDAIAYRTRKTARGKSAEEGGDSTGEVQRDKLIIDTDLKLLAKWDPRRYGERMTVAGDKDNPLEVKTQRAMTDAELLAVAASEQAAKGG